MSREILIVISLDQNSSTKRRDADVKFVDLITMLNKFLHRIKTYNNVFSNIEKEKLFHDLVPHLKFLENYPGLQTYAGMKKYIPHIEYFAFNRCWMNFTDVNFPDYELWHTHPTKRAGVYFFDDCSGTIFEGKFGKFQLKGVANSIITFPGNLIHAAPLNKSGARYTMAFEILEEFSSVRIS